MQMQICCLFAGVFITRWPPPTLVTACHAMLRPPGLLVTMHLMLCADLVTSPGVVIVSVDVDTPGNVGRLLLQGDKQVHGLTIKS